MNSPRTIFLLLLALLVSCFGLAAHLQPQFQVWRGSRASGDIFNVVLGDSRRMFAQSFYVKADAYYHSGYYPTMFDNKTAFQTAHMAADTGAVNDKNHGDEHGFLGPTRDWIDAFGRHFFPDRHTHLDEGGADDDLGGSDNVREILPWLKLSAAAWNADGSPCSAPRNFAPISPWRTNSPSRPPARRAPPISAATAVSGPALTAARMALPIE